MPGKKDFLSVMENGARKHIHKSLVLSNLKEVYQLFSEKDPNIRIWFSKFAEHSKRMCLCRSKWYSLCVYVPFIKMLSL